MMRWLSAAELAGLPGMPTTERRVRARADRESWEWRQRRGRGGGREYAFESLPSETRQHLARRWVRESAPAAAPVAHDSNAPMLAALPEPKLRRADARLFIVKRAEAFAQAAGIAQTRADWQFAGLYNSGEIAFEGDWAFVHDELPRLSPPMLANWRRRQARDGAAALAGKHRGRRESGVIERNPVLRELIESQLLTQPHLSATQILENCRARLPDARLPGLRRLQKWIERWKDENAAKLLYATNPDKHRSSLAPAFGSRSAAVRRLNQLWEMDGTPLDAMCTDGHHIIVGSIDVRSRGGKVLVSRSEKSTAVTALLRRCILDWGVPEVVKTDQGKAFRSRHVGRALAALDITHDMCAVRRPDQKPHIERFFGTLSHDLLERLPGYKGHNVAERQAIRARTAWGDRRGQTDDDIFHVALSAAELQAACDAWCSAVYARRRHSALGRSPFEAAAAEADTVRRIADERALDVLLAEAPGDGGFRTVSNKGLRVDRGLYIAPELGALIGARVQVRYDDADLGRVYVFDADGRFLCIAEDAERLGIDRAAHAMAAQAAAKAQTAVWREEQRQRRRDHRPEDLAGEVLARAQAEAGRVVAFPARAEEHTTEALEEAARAVLAHEPVAAPQLDADQRAVAEERWQELTAEPEASDPDARPRPQDPDHLFAVWVIRHPDQADDDDRAWLAEYMRSETARDLVNNELQRREAFETMAAAS